MEKTNPEVKPYEKPALVKEGALKDVTKSMTTS